MKKLIVTLSVLASGMFMTTSAYAVSVLDAATKASVLSGFTDMKDTVLDLTFSIIPVFVVVLAIMLGPKIIKRLANML